MKNERDTDHRRYLHLLTLPPLQEDVGRGWKMREGANETLGKEGGKRDGGMRRERGRRKGAEGGETRRRNE